MKRNTMLTTSVMAALMGAATLLGANMAMAEKAGGMGTDMDGDRERVCEHRKGHGHRNEHKHSWKQGHHRRDEFDGPVVRNLDLDATDIKTLMSARLIMRGNDRLKVGKVVEGRQGTYDVDIVTVDDSLVRTMTISRQSGRPVPPVMDDVADSDTDEG